MDLNDAYFRQLAMEMSGDATPSPQDEFLFGLTYKEYFNLSEEEAAALWDEAHAEESARLDHEAEHEARSNAHVADHPLNAYRFVSVQGIVGKGGTGEKTNE